MMYLYLLLPFIIALAIGYIAKAKYKGIKSEGSDKRYIIGMRSSVFLVGVSCLNSVALIYLALQDSGISMAIFYIVSVPIFLLGLFLLVSSLITSAENVSRIITKMLHIR
ncbi:hypothetical protein BST96_05010 [Oceanicoccus sagamiensis]|uniref:Uncharacterized protein n=1 Tax=Oceanicoccus sagamiensis TaxID=716816 RepID=A0A1X9NCA9_9GAMM|nr:hypothetical protein BST96_05010 [Oceanicoccus sagamiensis]